MKYWQDKFSPSSVEPKDSLSEYIYSLLPSEAVMDENISSFYSFTAPAQEMSIQSNLSSCNLFGTMSDYMSMSQSCYDVHVHAHVHVHVHVTFDLQVPCAGTFPTVGYMSVTAYAPCAVARCSTGVPKTMALHTELLSTSAEQEMKH